jgi:hypothetical protein
MKQKRELTKLENRHRRHLDAWLAHYRPEKTVASQLAVSSEQ